MLFSEALQELKKGNITRRRCWQDQEVFVMFEKNERTVLLVNGNILIPYNPSHADLIADDWIAL